MKRTKLNIPWLMRILYPRLVEDIRAYEETIDEQKKEVEGLQKNRRQMFESRDIVLAELALADVDIRASVDNFLDTIPEEDRNLWVNDIKHFLEKGRLKPVVDNLINAFLEASGKLARDYNQVSFYRGQISGAQLVVKSLVQIANNKVEKEKMSDDEKLEVL